MKFPPIKTDSDDTTVTSEIVRNTPTNVRDTFVVYGQRTAEGDYRVGVNDERFTPPSDMIELDKDAWEQLFSYANEMAKAPELSVDDTAIVLSIDHEDASPEAPSVEIHDRKAGVKFSLSLTEVHRLDQFFEDARAALDAATNTTPTA